MKSIINSDGIKILQETMNPSHKTEAQDHGEDYFVEKPIDLPIPEGHAEADLGADYLK